MTQRDRRIATTYPLVFAAIAACTTPNPNYRKPHSDASVDASGPGRCEPGAALKCDGTNLIRCNPDGTAEVSEPCSLGCNDTALRCFDADPSNGLARFLDLASGQPDINLGDSATIDTNTGEVKVGGNAVHVFSETVAQPSGPSIRVFAVKSLVAKEVFVSGKNALAIVSSGALNLNGTFAASANKRVPGAGAFADGNCRGQSAGISTPNFPRCAGGFGGGGFGSPGGSGGSLVCRSAVGGAGGSVTGNAELVPLRGGCGSGDYDASSNSYNGGAPGGAIQLVSRTLIAVAGTVATNGGSGSSRDGFLGSGGGGSGGGILFEAPVVNVSGRVVANGAGGQGKFDGQDGQLHATPANGDASDVEYFGRGGNGAAGNVGATDGGSPSNVSMFTYGGGGGGGAGRIRVNTASGGVRGTGLFSPAPSTGTLGSR